MAAKRAGKHDQARKKSPSIEGHTTANTNNNNNSKKNNNTCNGMERRKQSRAGRWRS